MVYLLNGKEGEDSYSDSTLFGDWGVLYIHYKSSCRRGEMVFWAFQLAALICFISFGVQCYHHLCYTLLDDYFFVRSLDVWVSNLSLYVLFNSFLFWTKKNRFRLSVLEYQFFFVFLNDHDLLHIFSHICFRYSNWFLCDQDNEIF